ncbi:hypothetical protein Tsp_08827 [Trichinella spiralis]|uniref:hypothetical protein n=1 Tax=Trichinella spiralis TaxID=6334 RepID=UPI0001EFE6B8|nr:hypothetical protein Tsp_08827 [Trichinella spiralis]
MRAVVESAKFVYKFMLKRIHLSGSTIDGEMSVTILAAILIAFNYSSIDTSICVRWRRRRQFVPTVFSNRVALLIHNKAEAEWKHRFESFVCVFVERGAFSANESYLYSASYVSTVILSRLIKSILLLIWADIFIGIWVSLPWAISFLGAATTVARIEFYGQLSNSGCRFTKNFVHGVWLAVVA